MYDDTTCHTWTSHVTHMRVPILTWPFRIASADARLTIPPPAGVAADPPPPAASPPRSSKVISVFELSGWGEVWLLECVTWLIHICNRPTLSIMLTLTELRSSVCAMTLQYLRSSLCASCWAEARRHCWRVWHAHIRTHTHTHTRTHAQTATHTHAHPHSHTHKQTCTHAHTHTRTHTNTHTHTHTHTQTHTHTHSLSLYLSFALSIGQRRGVVAEVCDITHSHV